MGAVIRSVLMGLLRYALAGVIGWMVTNGIADEQQVDMLVGGLAGGIVLVGWLVWVKYRDRLKFLTALEKPAGATEADVQAAVKTGSGATLSAVFLALAVGGSTLASVGCAGGGGLVAMTPTPEQVQAIRDQADRAADVTTIALGVVNEVGVLLDSLQIPDSAKDRYDCAILAVTGTSQPASATVTKVCGAVPLHPVAPLTVALESLRSVTTCPGLRSTISSLYAWISPLITQFEAAENAALKMAGASLRVALGLLSSGGVSCSA